MSSVAARRPATEAKPPPAAGRDRRAARQRAYRQRKRAGEAIFRIRVADRVIEALLVCGRLSDDASRDRERVQCELAGVRRRHRAVGAFSHAGLSSPPWRELELIIGAELRSFRSPKNGLSRCLSSTYANARSPYRMGISCTF